MAAIPILHTLHAVDPSAAEGAQKEVPDRAVKQAGFLPNMYANMANAPGVLSTRLHGYGPRRSAKSSRPIGWTEAALMFVGAAKV